MSFSFEINKLGPVRDSKVDFNKFLIFTGNSNTGKSYVAMLFYYFIKHLSVKLIDFVKQEYNIEQIKTELANSKYALVNFNPSSFNSWIDNGAEKYLGYLLKREKLDCDIHLQSGIKSFDIIIEVIANDIQKSVGNMYSFKVLENRYTANTEIPIDSAISRLIFLTLSQEYLHLGDIIQTLLLPPARGALMGFSFSDKSAIATSAGMYKDFLTDFDRINSNFFETKNDEFLKTRIFDCIDGDIIQQDDDIYYEQKNNISIPLSAVASSIKELSPLVIALTKVDPKQLSIMFEEPEAHLHPSLQVDVAKVISYLVNKGSFIQVTTHSDIFLSQINNLLRISKLRKQNQTYFEKLLSDFDLPESLVLDDVNVSAYFFEKDENGLTRATLQDLKDGIPFDTFKKTYSKLYEESNLIDEYLLKLAK